MAFKNVSDFFLSIVDYFSRYSMLIPLKNIEARTIAKALLKSWISTFGVPLSIHSDRGSNFESDLIHELCRWLGTVKTKSTPYHPTSNSLVERTFRTAKELIRCVIIDSGIQWDESLPLIEMHMRASVSKATNFSAYEVVFGRKMNTNLGIDSQNCSYKGGYTDEYIKWLHNSKNTMERRIQERENKKDVEGLRSEPPFKLGEKVLVKILPKFKTCFGARYTGPYVVTRKLGKYSYTLQDSNGETIDRHHDHLKRYVQRMGSGISKIGTSIETASEAMNRENIKQGKTKQNSDEDDMKTKRPVRTKRPVDRYELVAWEGK